MRLCLDLALRLCIDYTALLGFCVAVCLFDWGIGGLPLLFATLIVFVVCWVLGCWICRVINVWIVCVFGVVWVVVC